MALFVLMTCSHSGAAVLYVNTAAPGSNDGSSWTNAYTDLQPALAAAVAGGEIWVAAGTYKPTTTTTRSISFALKNGVGVYGGFLGTESARGERNAAANVTTLSGDIGTAGSNSDNSYHVVTADSSVTASGVLDGFTISGGNAGGGAAPDDRGGGLLASGGSPTVAHCVFTGNTASNRGGGVRVDGGSAAFLDCAFTANSANMAGGGVSAGTVSSLTVTRCLIRGNTTFATTGGGIDVTNATTITDCLIAQNSNNGVVFFQGDNALRDSTVTGHGGYGVSALSGSSTIVNSILWGDATGETVLFGSGFLDVTYSDIQGGASGAGNINANPLFVNAGGGDWRPGSGSPAVDSGNNAAVAAGITTDLGGRPRFFDDPAKADTGAGTAPIVDMGAYERVPLSVGAPAPASHSVCSGTGVSFSVTASGYQPAYRWRRNGGNLSDGGAISGAATAILTIDPTATADAGSFDAVVTDPFGQSATSSAATLTVKPSPSALMTAPAAVCANRAPYSASVPSAGAGASYAWAIVNGAITAGAGSNAVTFAAGGSGFVELSVTVTGANGCAAQSSPSIPIVACEAEPRSLLVDPVPDGALSDGNGILEPGETAVVRPFWKNLGGSPLDLSGAASNFTGPAGATYTLNDAAAGYGSISAGATSDCATATGNCYEMTVSNPPTRPATHWDSTFTETLSDGDPATVWRIHIGQSFTDVPKNHVFYSFVERILHNGVTTGCTGTTYCPDATVFRLQMAVFIARAQAGSDTNVPVSGSAQGNPYNCVGGGQSQFTDIDAADPFCRHVHYLFATGVTTGCITTPPRQYCPGDNVSRGQMALFIGRAVAGSDAAVPLTYGPDPVTGRSYSCNAGTPNLHFTDIATSDIYCRHTHYLWAKDVISGFPDGSFGPALPVTRGAMAKFLANGFGLTLFR